MKHPLFFAAVAIVAALASAVALRISELPYIAFVKGQSADAMAGLQAKADEGDRFAAFLVATNYERGVLGAPDLGLASDWYVKAARLGEIRSVARYVSLKNTGNAEQCAKALTILNVAGRSGDLKSLRLLGWYYQSGFCVPVDLVTAARYYMASARIDRQNNEAVDAILSRLDPDAARQLQALPETFDGDEGVALAQFLAAVSYTHLTLPTKA